MKAVPYTAPTNDIPLDAVLSASRVIERFVNRRTLIPSPRRFSIQTFRGLDMYDVGMPIISVSAHSHAITWDDSIIFVRGDDGVVTIDAVAGWGYVAPSTSNVSVTAGATTGFGVGKAGDLAYINSELIFWPSDGDTVVRGAGQSEAVAHTSGALYKVVADPGLNMIARRVAGRVLDFTSQPSGLPFSLIDDQLKELLEDFRRPEPVYIAGDGLDAGIFSSSSDPTPTPSTVIQYIDTGTPGVGDYTAPFVFRTSDSTLYIRDETGTLYEGLIGGGGGGGLNEAQVRALIVSYGYQTAAQVTTALSEAGFASQTNLNIVSSALNDHKGNLDSGTRRHIDADDRAMIARARPTRSLSTGQLSRRDSAAAVDTENSYYFAALTDWPSSLDVTMRIPAGQEASLRTQENTGQSVVLSLGVDGEGRQDRWGVYEITGVSDLSGNRVRLTFSNKGLSLGAANTAGPRHLRIEYDYDTVPTTATPVNTSTAAVGTSLLYARGDHDHGITGGGGGGGDLTGIDAGTGITVSDGDTATPEVSISSGGVGTIQIADDAVTKAKIADDAVDSDQIVDDSVTTSKVDFDAFSKLDIPMFAGMHYTAFGNRYDVVESTLPETLEITTFETDAYVKNPVHSVSNTIVPITTWETSTIVLASHTRQRFTLHTSTNKVTNAIANLGSRISISNLDMATITRVYLRKQDNTDNVENQLVSDWQEVIATGKLLLFAYKNHWFSASITAVDTSPVGAPSDTILLTVHVDHSSAAAVTDATDNTMSASGDLWVAGLQSQIPTAGIKDSAVTNPKLASDALIGQFVWDSGGDWTQSDSATNASNAVSFSHSVGNNRSFVYFATVGPGVASLVALETRSGEQSDAMRIGDIVCDMHSEAYHGSGQAYWTILVHTTAAQRTYIDTLSGSVAMQGGERQIGRATLPEYSIDETDPTHRDFIIGSKGIRDSIPDGIPDAPDNVSTAKKYELAVPATSGDATWTEASAGGGGVAVQTDWDETDSTQTDYLQNKPDIVDERSLHQTMGKIHDHEWFFTLRATWNAANKSARRGKFAVLSTDKLSDWVQSNVTGVLQISENGRNNGAATFVDCYNSFDHLTDNMRFCLKKWNRHNSSDAYVDANELDEFFQLTAAPTYDSTYGIWELAFTRLKVGGKSLSDLTASYVTSAESPKTQMAVEVDPLGWYSSGATDDDEQPGSGGNFGEFTFDSDEVSGYFSGTDYNQWVVPVDGKCFGKFTARHNDVNSGIISSRGSAWWGNNNSSGTDPADNEWNTLTRGSGTASGSATFVASRVVEAGAIMYTKGFRAGGKSYTKHAWSMEMTAYEPAFD